MTAVILGSVGTQGLSTVPAAELLVVQHGQSRHLVGLLQERQGIVVRDIANVHPVDV